MNRRDICTLAGKVVLVALAAVFVPLSAFAGTLPQNYTIKEHAYLWRADGSSATQGTGSIVNYPNLTSGTASATLSQVTTAEVPTIPNSTGTLPGTGSFIKVVASGGASGGNIDISLNITAISQESLGNFGLYFYDPVGGSTDITGVTFYTVNNSGFTKFFIYNANGANAGATGRMKGWNLLSWQRGDQTTTGGGYTHAETTSRLMLRVSLGVNKSATFYLGDVIYGYYTKPQIQVWAADNGAGAYDTMFPYMQARGIPGSYAPTTDYLPAPNGSQITVAELLEMQAAGWSIIPHQTIGTALTSMSQSEMEAEIDEVLAVHASYGFTYREMYYPAGGATNDTANAVMASRGIRYANNANTGNLQKSMPLYGGLINPFRLWSYTADGKTFSEVRTAIDHAIKYGGYLRILWHDGDGADEAHFKSSMDYLYRLREANVIDLNSDQTFFTRFTSPRKAR